MSATVNASYPQSVFTTSDAACAQECRPTNEYVRDFLPTLDAVRQANGVHLVYATGTDYAMV
jgi:hypothetical protein